MKHVQCLVVAIHIKIVETSCGVGHFFISVEKIEIDVEALIRMLWSVDTHTDALWEKGRSFVVAASVPTMGRVFDMPAIDLLLFKGSGRKASDDLMDMDF